MARQSRQTKQKQAIADIIGKQEGHFTAASIAQTLEKSGIGIATVYRYLAEARKAGRVHSYLCNNERLYSTKQRSHCHFTCERCGTVEHVHIKDLSGISNQVTGEMCHIQIDISGVCSQCK